jgi:pyruvate formate lyase activating enzyme
MEEASLWRKAEGGRADCLLCSHRCKVAPGKRGVCGVRENREGTLYSLNYGRLISRAVDPIEKKPLYHFLPGTTSYSIATVGCNFRCRFCQNWQISQHRPRETFPGERASPEDVVRDAARRGCASIAYTYTEPTIFWEFARDTGRLAHGRGIANVFVTNGYQTPEAVEAMTGVIDAANVDLKAFTDDFYRELCGARLGPVLESIPAMRAAGIHVEVTTLVIPGRNDSEAELRKIASFVGGVSPDIAWHVSRFHPDYELTDAHWTPAESLERAVRAGREAGLRHVYVGNVASGETDTVCPSCGTVVIRRRGYATAVVALEGSTCAECGAALPVVRGLSRA